VTIAERIITWDEVENAWECRPGRNQNGNSGAITMRIARTIAGYIGQGVMLATVANRLDTTVGQVHHYRSLVTRLAPELQAAISADILRFKVGRALTRITDYNRQKAIAKLFIDGACSSVLAESIIKLAGDHRDWDTAKLLSVASGQGVAGYRSPTVRETHAPVKARVVAKPLPKVRDANDLPREILWMAGAMKIGADRPMTIAEKATIATTLHNLRAAADELAAAVAL